MKRGDFAVCAVVLLLAAGIFLVGLRRGTDGEQLVAVVCQDGAEIARVVLTGLQTPVTVTVDGAYQNIIVISGEGARVQSATCPHQTCVHTGLLTRAGQTAVCLENKMTLTLEGAGAPDVVIR